MVTSIHKPTEITKIPENSGKIPEYNFFRNYLPDSTEIWYAYSEGLSDELPISPDRIIRNFRTESSGISGKIPEYNFFRNYLPDPPEIWYAYS